MRIASALFVVLFATSALAQAVQESITVEVIDVPVYVASGGAPVSNLTREDFELYVNGRRQPIDYFDRIEADSASAPAKRNARPTESADLRSRRLFLLLFDLAFNRPVTLSRAQKAAAAMIDHRQPGDYFAIATFSAKNGAFFVTPFTRDTAVLRRAVLKLSPSDAHDPLSLAISSMETEGLDAFHPVNGGDEGDAALQEILTYGGDLRAQPMQRLVRNEMADFADMAARLAELEGTKHVVLLSGGFSSYLMTGAKPNLPAGTAPQVEPATVQQLQEMAARFKAAGAFLHTVDLGFRDPASSDPLSNEMLHMFARETGGQFLHGTNDITGELADLSKTTGSGYRLGFKPLNPRRGENSIEVKVKNLPRGATLSFRPGFTAGEPKKNDVDPLRLADIILNDTPQSGTPPTIAFGEKPFMLVRVPARALSRQFGEAQKAVVLLYVFDAKGAVVQFREKRLTIDKDAKQDLVVRNPVELKAGKYIAKALLRVGDSVGFARMEFELR